MSNRTQWAKIRRPEGGTSINVLQRILKNVATCRDEKNRDEKNRDEKNREKKVAEKSCGKSQG